MSNIIVSPILYIAVIIGFLLLVLLNIIQELRLNLLKRTLRVWLALGPKTEYVWYSLFGYSREQIMEAFKHYDINLPHDNT